MRASRRLLEGMVAALAATSVTGCGERSGPAGPAAPTIASVSFLSPPTSAMAGEALDVRVRVADDVGKPVAGATVRFEVTPGSGSVSPDQATTASDGTATAVWTLAATPGGQTLLARVGGLASTLQIAAASPAATLEIVAGDAQSRQRGAQLPGVLRVRLLDRLGGPVARAAVAFAAVQGGGTVSPASVLTDSLGYAWAAWWLGPAAGEQRAEARVATLPAATFRATALDLRIDIGAPLEQERFVLGDSIFGIATLTGLDRVEPDSIRWSIQPTGAGSWRTPETGATSLAAFLGLAPAGAGAGRIIVSALGAADTVGIRGFDDLWQFYLARPAPGEIERVRKDFDIHYVDGSGSDESWAPYGDTFDQKSLLPSRLVVVADLEALRHQRFTSPPPFTDGRASAYDWLRSLIKRIDLRLDCGYAFGGGVISLWRSSSHWAAPYEDSCKHIGDSPELPNGYLAGLPLVVHEARHSDPADPGHVTCPRGSIGDASLENGSGYAWSTLYAMWVYKYGRTDPTRVRDTANAWIVDAREIALVGLQYSMCTRPTHSDPRVQAIIDELLR